MSHDHNHSHSHGAVPDKINLAFGIGIGLNLLFTVIEFGVGWWKGSLALMSDAGHNLTDVGTLVISLIGMRLAAVSVTKRYTYGYKKATILASLINAVILLVLVIFIVIEAIGRIKAPQPVPGLPVMIVAAVGIVINTVSAFLFFKDKEKDINIKGAYLHLIADAAVSLGVVVSGAVIYYTGWSLMDPLISILIVIFILASSWSLFRESLRLIIDAVPERIDYEAVMDVFEQESELEDVHHVHIWPISSTSVAITAHLIPTSPLSQEDAQSLVCRLKHALEDLHIDHATLELEYDSDKCEGCSCE